jgi:hypothetical protein
MYDKNSPHDYDLMDQLNQISRRGIYVTDPTKQMNITTTDHNGIFGGVINDGSTYSEPWTDPIVLVKTRLDKLELQNKFLRLKILQLEGTFTKEEVANIRAMLTSNDEASITLADSIIENA